MRSGALRGPSAAPGSLTRAARPPPPRRLQVWIIVGVICGHAAGYLALAWLSGMQFFGAAGEGAGSLLSPGGIAGGD